MKFVPMSELLKDAVEGGYGIPSFCVWNIEVMNAILGVAQDLRAPVILMNGPGEFRVLDPELVVGAAELAARRYNVPAALHLDHGDSPERVRECLEAGYTSVMLDYSTRPVEENVEALRQVVSAAHPLGVTVEGEIGHVGRADTMTVEGEGDSTLTRPEQAADYVARTDVDALAVSIGNAHGRYAKLPRFDFERLEAIHRAVPVPLVLHGGSGTPDEDLKRAISLGMAKINVATELVTAMRESLRRDLTGDHPSWPPHAHAESISAMVPVMVRWLTLTGAAGRA